MVWRKESFGGNSLLCSTIKIEKRDPDSSCSCTAEGREAKNTLKEGNFPQGGGEKDTSLQILTTQQDKDLSTDSTFEISTGLSRVLDQVAHKGPF